MSAGLKRHFFAVFEANYASAVFGFGGLGINDLRSVPQPGEPQEDFLHLRQVISINDAYVREDEEDRDKMLGGVENADSERIENRL